MNPLSTDDQAAGSFEGGSKPGGAVAEVSRILSVRIDALDLQGILSRIGDFLKGSRLHQIATVNPEFVMAAQHDGDFLRILNSTDLNVADGIGLQLAAKIAHVKIGERVTGVDLTWTLARLAAEKGYSLFLLGAAEGVARKAGEALVKSVPRLKIAGAYAGAPDEDGIVELINDSGADILCVAFGSPKQEKFIFENRDKLKAKIAMGVGGTFDYIAGVVPRAPLWMRNMGLEWLYRLFMQPKRVNRIITAVVRFPFRVVVSRRPGKTRN